MDIRPLSAIQTAENVTLRVELAGLGNRVLAFGIDLIAMGSLMAAVALLLSLGLAWSPEANQTAMPIAMFILFFGFQFFQEWLWHGKSLGKHVLGLRVVRDNGQPIGFWEAFGRNLLRVVDVYLMGLGLICLMISGREKRLGDFLCSTLVIREQTPHKPFIPTTSELAGLSPEEQELLRAFSERKNRLLSRERQALAEAMRAYYVPRVNGDEPGIRAVEDLLG